MHTLETLADMYNIDYVMVTRDVIIKSSHTRHCDVSQHRRRCATVAQQHNVTISRPALKLDGWTMLHLVHL